MRLIDENFNETRNLSKQFHSEHESCLSLNKKQISNTFYSVQLRFTAAKQCVFVEFRQQDFFAKKILLEELLESFKMDNLLMVLPVPLVADFLCNFIDF
jgi:hypothetical protein